MLDNIHIPTNKYIFPLINTGYSFTYILHPYFEQDFKHYSIQIRAL
jgi:hypothetical protein